MQRQERSAIEKNVSGKSVANFFGPFLAFFGFMDLARFIAPL
jgi:hypothetical protein